jgi:hypothetical protein
MQAKAVGVDVWTDKAVEDGLSVVGTGWVGRRVGNVDSDGVILAVFWGGNADATSGVVIVRAGGGDAFGRQDDSPIPSRKVDRISEIELRNIRHDFNLQICLPEKPIGVHCCQGIPPIIQQMALVEEPALNWASAIQR